MAKFRNGGNGGSLMVALFEYIAQFPSRSTKLSTTLV
jgi:hypothetical protein